PPRRVTTIHHATPGQLASWLDGLGPAGYLPVWVHAHESGESGRCAAIAVKPKQPTDFRASPPIPRRDLQQQLAKARGLDGRLLYLTGFAIQGEEVYCLGVARGDYPALDPLPGIPPTDYAREVERLRGRKQRPYSLTGAPKGDSGLLTMVVGPDDGTPW